MSGEATHYKLPEETLPEMDYAFRLADLIEFKGFIEAHGITVTNTRIDRYIKYLDQIVAGKSVVEVSIFKNSRDERFKSAGDWSLYILREVDELMWILKGLKTHAPAGLAARLEQLVSGSDFAALDVNSSARDVQFELRIASYFCQAGFQVDLSTTTDIIALCDEFAFFIECKRIAAASQVKHRLTDAAKQLDRRMPRKYLDRQTFGYIALDVTKVAFTHNGLTWGITNEHSRDIVQSKLKSIAGLVSRDVHAGGAKRLLKCWLQIHIPCLIANPPSVMTRISSYYIENSQIDRRAIDALLILREVDAISQTSPDSRVRAPEKLVPRNVLKIPAGTVFETIEMSIIQQLFQTGKVVGIPDDKAIGAIKLNGTRHEFTVNDLMYHVGVSNAEARQNMLKDEIQFRFELLIDLFLRRYPYENISTPAPTFPPVFQSPETDGFAQGER